MKKVFVTGAAGFIGAALVKHLIKNGKVVIGLDNLNSYYDTNLKKSRLRDIETLADSYNGKWTFYKPSLKMNLI